MAQMTLEGIVTHPKGYGLTKATPVQRAICRVSEGYALGDLWQDEDVQRCLGGNKPPERAPRIIVVLGAIRGGKSIFAAGRSVVASQTCDLSGLSPGDEVRIPMVATEKDTAGQVFSHVANTALASPVLRGLMVGEPTADSVHFKHPSGRHIEIKVAALGKAGSTLVGRWLGGAVFDEAPRMVGEDDGVRNLDDNIQAVAGRILPGGQILLIGSPWAPFGPIYDLVEQRFGKPDEDIVVIRATGPMLNPSYWTPARCERYRLSPLVKERMMYRTDVLGEFADPEDSMFSSEALVKNTRADAVRPAEDGMHYVAAMDPGGRASAWTLVVVGCTGSKGYGRPTYSVVLAKQWMGSAANPLKPRIVLSEIAQALGPYGVDTIFTDQFAYEALNDLAYEFKVGLVGTQVQAAERLQHVEAIRAALHENRLEVPPDPYLRTDLLRTRKRVTSNGVTIQYPQSGDGRHCDYVPALGLAMMNPPQLPAANDNADGGRDAVFDKILADERRRASDPFSVHVTRLAGG
jgi:hypothetical protein